VSVSIPIATVPGTASLNLIISAAKFTNVNIKIAEATKMENIYFMIKAVYIIFLKIIMCSF
jgi:hypothetical protein